MAPVTYTSDTATREANDYGIRRLKELMVGLYHDYQIISGSRERIKGLLPEYLSAKEDCKLKIADLNIKKRDLKKNFREGRLPQKSYMEQLSDLKNQIVEQEQALNVAFGNLFSPVLSECTHCDNLVGVIQTLS